MAPLRIAALEIPHRFGRPDAVLRDLDVALATLRAHADLVLLPECALTGYVSPRGDFDLSRFAEPLDGPTATALGALARTHGLSLAGPVVEREGALRFNTLCLFGPDGARVARWQKRHPWYPERWASEGRHCFEVVEHRGLTFTACICFDVHFVADDASTSLQRADVLLYPSAWVDEGDDDARAPLLEGLATRFELTVVNANWGVGVPAVPGQGRSRIVSPSGAGFEASDAPWSAAVATVDRRGANGVVAE